MTYLKVAWTHNFPNEPVEILSELDQERYEMRKIERFRDGALHLIGPEGTPSEEDLAENEMPPEHLIALSSELKILPTSKEEFEQLWQSATISSAA